MKRPLTLLEVMIGLVLTAILLTSLFSCYRTLVQNNVKMQRLRKDLHWELVMQTRLNQVFETLQEGSLFYTDANVLHFIFNNGIDPDPDYCGEIEGTLSYIPGKKQEFSLTLKDTRKEVFLKTEKPIQIVFFDPKNLEWISSWSGNLLPPMIKILAEEKEFVFFIPKSTAEARFS